MNVGIWGSGRAAAFFARGIAGSRGPAALHGILARKRRAAESIRRACGRGRLLADPGELADECDVLLLCLSDGALEGCAGDLASRKGLRSKVVLHCSGALGLEVLSALRGRGAHAGRIHPLAALPPAGSPESDMESIWYAVEGDGKAAGTARRLARQLGGRAFELPRGAREGYHLAATLIANHSTVLAARAFELLGARPGRELREAFAGLLRSVARRIEEHGPREALTGPAARGDLRTLRRHLGLLDGKDELREIYAQLSLQAAGLARERGDLGGVPDRLLEAPLRKASKRRR